MFRIRLIVGCNSFSRFDSSAYLLRSVRYPRHRSSITASSTRFRVVVIVWAIVLLALSLFVVFFVGPVFVLSAMLVITMADNFDKTTPAPVTSSSPQATAFVPVVESDYESVVTPSNPTMAALFDIARARSSSSVAPPPVPVATSFGYVSFTGVVRHASNVATNDPADVIGAPASS